MSGVIQLTFYYPVRPSRALAAVVTDLIDEFNRMHPAIAVKPIFIGGYEETMAAVQAAVRAKRPPDIAVLYSGLLITLRNLDAIIPLDDYIAAAGGAALVEDFFPAFLMNVRAEGHIWALPFQKGTMLLYYNKALFQEAGLDPEATPQTWEQLAAVARQLTLRSDNRVIRWGLEVPAAGLSMIFQGFIYQQADEFFSPDGTQVYLAIPEARRALGFLADLSQRHHVMPAEPLDWYDVPAHFVAQNTAMIIHSTSSFSFVREQAGFPFGTGFLPRSDRYGVSIGGGELYIFKDITVEQRDAAWVLLEWLTAPEQQARWCIASGYIAVRRSAWMMPALRHYLRTFPQAAVALDQLSYGGPELMTHAVEEVRRVMREAIETAIAGRQSAEAAVAEAQAKADVILSTFGTV